MMKKKIIRRAIAAACLALLAAGCSSDFAKREDISAITVVWIPNQKLRSAKLEMKLSAALIDIFTEKLGASGEVDAIWVPNLILVEGRYEITIGKTGGGEDKYELSGDSILYSPASKKHYQNKDLHLFVYQLLFAECVKRGIRLN